MTLETVTRRVHRNISDTLREAGTFAIMSELIERTGLEPILAEVGPYTLFAPGDDAFDRWPVGALDGLVEDPRLLTQIVTYHLVRGRLSSVEAAGRQSALTVQGEELFLSINGGIRVDGAHLIESDIQAFNGVIHIIDRVLMPAQL